jgi:cytochrome c-type biogenesis protein CcsB
MKILFLICISLFSSMASAIDVSNFENIAIQDGGRVKPFDTFARESVQLLTGSQKYNGKNPTELVLAWLIFPNEWSSQKFIEIKNLELKKDLGLAPTDSFVSPIDLIHNQKLSSTMTELAQLQKAKKKLNPYFQAVNHINNQLILYNDIITGTGLRFIPQALSPDWLPLADLKGTEQEVFGRVASGFLVAIAKHDEAPFQKAVTEFKNEAKNAAPQAYPSEEMLKREIIYNQVHPFRLAYIIYLLAALVLAFALQFPKKSFLRSAGLLTLGAGLIVHISGFIFRCIIAGRPPVSNMYESIIWVSLGCVVFGMVFELIYKRVYIGLAAASVATLGLIIGDSVPAVLDQSIRPLEPVLRSNYWLTIHVLTITLSYAAFALAMGIGNIALSYYVRGVEEKNAEKLRALSLFIYRAVQVGVLLLTAGTILGGVWADYSWGRFWGWDPKETWALIADLGYLACLHGRFSGWLRTYGTIASTVVCFSGVVMAWYGVNFVLGVGLHSYGFGGGGVHYVTAIVVAQLLYVGWAGLNHKKFLNQKAPKPA